jgi:SdrD B-like domain
VNLAIGPIIEGPALMSSTTGLLTAAWADRGEHLQLNLLEGEVSGKPSALGAWVDGSIAQGRFLQNAGIFRIEPNMTWGNQLISNDAQGGYYRLNYQSRQWLADVGIDEVHSVSGLGTSTTFLTGDTRYQLSRDWGVGSVANISRSDGGTSWSLEGYVDHSNAGGTGRAQADYAQTPAGRDTTLTLNEMWSTPAAVRLSTSASVERISGAVINGLQQDSTVLSIAAYGGGQLIHGLGVEGNVRWAKTIQGQAAPGVSANVSLTWQLSQAWEILATYYDSQVGSWTPLTVVSPLTPPVATPVPAVQERGVFLTLRYRRASGSHFAPLGGAPGAGSGEIAGVVFLDANNNGHADAGEAGAPNVTVVLDGRFSVQTNATGRFSFPVVATGHHRITVVPDNLPLPWALINEGRAEVEVTTRNRTEISIAAQRQR